MCGIYIVSGDARLLEMSILHLVMKISLPKMKMLLAILEDVYKHFFSDAFNLFIAGSLSKDYRKERVPSPTVGSLHYTKWR